MPKRDVDTRTPPWRASTHLIDPTTCDLKKPISSPKDCQSFPSPGQIQGPMMPSSRRVLPPAASNSYSRSPVRGQAEKSFRYGEHFACGADVIVIGGNKSESERVQQVLAWRQRTADYTFSRWKVIELNQDEIHGPLLQHQTAALKNGQVETLRLDLKQIDVVDRVLRAKCIQGGFLYTNTTPACVESRGKRVVRRHAVGCGIIVLVHLHFADIGPQGKVASLKAWVPAGSGH